MSRRLREPRQQRSQETLERILVSAEELLRKAGATDVSVREICSGAGASPSSFYARFPERSTLHLMLFDRFTRRVLAMLEAFREEDVRVDGGFDAFALRLIDRFTLRWYEESGLIRALAAEEAGAPELRSKRQWLDREILRRSLVLVGEFHAELDVEATEARILDALPAISASFRGAADSSDQLGFDAPDARERLVRALTNQLLGFVVRREVGVSEG